MLLYGEPIFRGRCERIGAQFRICAVPEVHGHTRIFVGDNVSFFGLLSVASCRGADEPCLVFNDGSQIGHNVSFVVGQQVLVGPRVMIGNNCFITDTETPPRDAAERKQLFGPVGKRSAPVKIQGDVWYGSDCTVYRGVTIGEGSIIGARSVVISDVPAYSIAMGNPARVVGYARRSPRSSLCNGRAGAHPRGDELHTAFASRES